MRTASVVVAVLLASLSAHADVRLDPAAETVPVDPLSGKGHGTFSLTLTSGDPAAITLRAMPLVLDGAYASIQFLGAHSATPDLQSLHCAVNVACHIDFDVVQAWKSGLYQGKITIETPSSVLGGLPVTAMRAPPAFQPVLTSDALKGDRLVLDVTQQPGFLLNVQDPAGVTPVNVALTSSTDAALACDPAPLSLSPDHFHLEPGEPPATVIAQVNRCVPQGEHFVTLHIADSDHPTLVKDIVLDVTRHASSSGRTLWLLGFVLVGSVISVTLNNIFPVSRARTALRSSLRQINATLRECAQSGAALLDGLTAESKRIELSLKQVHFFSQSKANDIQSAHGGIANLTTAAALAKRIGQTRSTADSATLSIMMHALIRQKLRDAEDALRTGDAQTASDAQAGAQSKLIEAQNDVQQTALNALLGKQLDRMMTERGRLVTPATTGASSTAVPAAILEQEPSRNPRIRELVERLAKDVAKLGKPDARDPLDIERDLYIADVWTAYVEPKLRDAPDRFRVLAESLLDSLLRNPKSDQVQTLLDLLRSETTPQEIALSLQRGEGRIVCDSSPRALQSVDIAFDFTHPALRPVAAAKRLLVYTWDTNDDTSPPPSVDRFRHYFRLTPRGPLFARETRTDYKITLQVGVPFSSFTTTFPFTAAVKVRRGEADWWKVEPMELASFIVTAAIAVATAFGTQYAGSLPDTITWTSCLSAFMLGFGLDQLRDTVTPAAAGIPTGAPVASPSAAPATAPRPTGT